MTQARRGPNGAPALRWTTGHEGQAERDVCLGMLGRRPFGDDKLQCRDPVARPHDAEDGARRRDPEVGHENRDLSLGGDARVAMMNAGS